MLVCFGSSALPLKDAWSLPKSACVENTFKRFQDGESFFQIHTPVTNQDILLIQSTCSPANDHLFEFLIMVDALRQGFAKHITAFMPYFGYGLQDRITTDGASISGKVAAQLVGKSGIDRLLTLDLHTPQMAGFFPIPVQNLSMHTLFAHDIMSRFQGQDGVIVSPDLGGIKRAEMYASLFDTPLAVLHKHRRSTENVHVSTLYGEVEGKVCLILDDIMNAGNTLIKSVEFLHTKGAKEIHAYITHGIFSNGINILDEAPHLLSLTLSDSIPLSQNHPKIRRVSIIPLLHTLMPEKTYVSSF